MNRVLKPKLIHCLQPQKGDHTATGFIPYLRTTSSSEVSFVKEVLGRERHRLSANVSTRETPLTRFESLTWRGRKKKDDVPLKGRRMAVNNIEMIRFLEKECLYLKRGRSTAREGSDQPFQKDIFGGDESYKRAVSRKEIMSRLQQKNSVKTRSNKRD